MEQGEKEFASWVEKLQHSPRRMSPRDHTIIKSWFKDGDPGKRIPFSTFDFIIQFFQSGDTDDRFQIACADFGIIPEELAAMKEKGKSALDVAKKIIKRGHGHD